MQRGAPQELMRAEIGLDAPAVDERSADRRAAQLIFDKKGETLTKAPLDPAKDLHCWPGNLIFVSAALGRRRRPLHLHMGKCDTYARADVGNPAPRMPSAAAHEIERHEIEAVAEFECIESGRQGFVWSNWCAVAHSRLNDDAVPDCLRLDVSEIAHDAEPRVRQPVDTTQAIVGRRCERLSLPPDVLELQVRAIWLRERQVAAHRVGRSAICGKLEVWRPIGTVARTPEERPCQQPEASHARKQLERQMGLHLLGTRAEGE